MESGTGKWKIERGKWKVEQENGKLKGESGKLNSMDTNIDIINQMGVVLKSYKLDSGTHSISLDLPSGVYFIRNGNTLYEKLLITK